MDAERIFLGIVGQRARCYPALLLTNSSEVAQMTTSLRATAVPRIEDERLVATEWRMPPGSETGWHRHEFDYAVVYLTSGNLFVESKDGGVMVPLERGQVTSRQSGVEHNVKNPNSFEFVFVELELKRGRAT
jgi:quercetin dioxygenase-like cupin family protein